MHNRIHKASLLTSCLLAIGAPGGALAAPTVEAVEQALAEHSLNKAGNALNDLIEARLPAKAPAGPDPVLDRVYVDLAASSGATASAMPLLKRLVADRRTPDLGHYRLLAGVAEEELGQFDAAEQQYRALSGDQAADADSRRDAVLGLARLQLSVNPAAVQAMLAGQSPPRSAAWEFELLKARASSMTSPDPAAARAALDAAWSGSVEATLTQAGPARVAADRAIVAGRAGDRKTLVSMLAVDRYDRGANDGHAALAADLPLCGTAGITAQDRVILDVVHLPAVGRPKATLLWASRPGIAGPFLAAAARSGAFAVSSGQAAAVELACRAAPSSDYVVRNTLEEATAAWMTSQGAYPLFVTEDGLNASQIASMLAGREARYGATSIMLLPVLLRNMAGGAAMFGDQEARKQASQAVTRIGTILQANHAPADLLTLWQVLAVGSAIMAQTKTPAEGQTEIQALLVKAAVNEQLSLDMVYMLASSSSRAPNAPVTFQQAMLGAALDLLRRKAPAGDQRTAAIALRLYTVRKSLGDDQGALAAIASLAMPPDVCSLSDPQPHYVSSNIMPDDYPGDLIAISLRGLVQIEFDLDGTGAARNGRAILADPPFAFTDITLQRVATIRYDPARKQGQPVSCRAVTQAVRWQLPY